MSFLYYINHDYDDFSIHPHTPSGKLTVCYWTWPIEIVDLPINSMVIFNSYMHLIDIIHLICLFYTIHQIYHDYDIYFIHECPSIIPINIPIPMGRSRVDPGHLGALKRLTTCNWGPRGTVSWGFHVSKEQVEAERLPKPPRNMRKSSWFHGI